MLLIAALLAQSVLGQSREIKLQAEFLRYRQDAISLIQQHEDCILKKAVPALQRAVILVAYSDDDAGAWCFQDRKIGASVIVINSKFKRSRCDAIVTLIHEALHLADVCGPDVREPDSVPVCVLFERAMLTSTEISNAIKDHLFTKDCNKP